MSRTLIGLIALLSSCISAKGGDDTASIPSDLSACEADPSRVVSVGNASITGDTLSLEVSYGGGCEAHHFTLCWPDQTFMESAPVQVNLEVLDQGEPDYCDAYMTEGVSFDLTELKLRYQSSYATTNGVITVHVDGETVEYSF